MRSALDGRVRNRNVAEYRLLEDRHLTPGRAAKIDDETIVLEMETNQSGIIIAVAARTRAYRDDEQLFPRRSLLTDDTG